MSDVKKIKRGVDIKLVGEADKEFAPDKTVKTIAIKPIDFNGSRLKPVVKEGDEVKAGTPLLYSKDSEQVKFCSTVSGEVAQVVRGAKRRLLEIRVLADSETEYVDFGAADPNTLEKEAVIEKMAASGCWPFLKQRPYNVVADPEKIPKAIFISGFDSAPLAPDMSLLLEGQEKEFQAGINALKKLTDGEIHLGLSAREAPSPVLANAEGVTINKYDGPHPAGVVGVQIAQVSPINRGETVWTINPEHVVIIGRLFLEGKFEARIRINVTGSEVNDRKYHNTIIGANVSNFIEGNITDGTNRVISGNVLTGTKIDDDGYLSMYERQVTVLPEGDEPELFGWLIPKTDKFSISRTLPSWVQRKFGDKKYELDTNTNGERRAFVVSGEYEQVFPFDIYPVQLLKAVITQDIERMEQLGIYEVVEEDMALCEVVCTSKMPVQSILRDGLDMMRKELG